MNCSVRLARWWREEQGVLVARLQLDGFAAVREAVTALMALAEQLDHHPEVRFGYRQLEVRWTTHDVGGLTDRDWQAALATDTLLASFHVIAESA